MKTSVMKGFLSPLDKSQKSARRAVILGQEGNWVYVAPATTYFARSARVPHGHVLLTSKSPAYPGSGFDKEEILISIRDAGRFHVQSLWIKDMTPIGTLDLSRDKRLMAQFREVMSVYDLTTLPEWQ